MICAGSWAAESSEPASGGCATWDTAAHGGRSQLARQLQAYCVCSGANGPWPAGLALAAFAPCRRRRGHRQSSWAAYRSRHRVPLLRWLGSRPKCRTPSAVAVAARLGIGEHSLFRTFCWRQPFPWQSAPDDRDAAFGKTGVCWSTVLLQSRLLDAVASADRRRGRPTVTVNLEPIFGSIDDYAPSSPTPFKDPGRTGRPPVVACHSMGAWPSGPGGVPAGSRGTWRTWSP